MQVNLSEARSQVRNKIDDFLACGNCRGGDLRASIIPSESWYAASAAAAG